MVESASRIALTVLTSVISDRSEGWCETVRFESATRRGHELHDVPPTRCERTCMSPTKGRSARASVDQHVQAGTVELDGSNALGPVRPVTTTSYFPEPAARSGDVALIEYEFATVTFVARKTSLLR